MWNKKGKKPARAKKLAGEIFEYLVLSVIVAVFTFFFLYLTSQSIVEVYLDRRQIIPEGIVNKHKVLFHQILQSSLRGLSRR